MIGKTIASAKLRAYVASGRRPETYLFTSPLDGAERLISLQRIFDRPLLAAPANLYFSLGLASDDYFQKWREEARAAAWSLLRFWHEREARQIQSRAFEREHAVNEERLRIMQDLHDGVGSQLLSALMMVQDGNASREQTVLLLQECMDDMRLVIDTLAPDEPDLLPVLGNFRFRMEARYRAVGLDFLWINHALPDTLTLAPHAGLQLLRVLQEALANVLRHAQARRVKVEVYFCPARTTGAGRGRRRRHGGAAEPGRQRPRRGQYAAVRAQVGRHAGLAGRRRRGAAAGHGGRTGRAAKQGKPKRRESKGRPEGQTHPGGVAVATKKDQGRRRRGAAPVRRSWSCSCKNVCACRRTRRQRHRVASRRKWFPRRRANAPCRPAHSPGWRKRPRRWPCCAAAAP
jgi:hypothetical protein